MKKTRFTDEQMVTILREADRRPVPEVAKRHGVSAQTIYSGVVARIVTGPHDAHRQDPHLPMRYDTGRPRAVIRSRISQPRTTSHSPVQPNSGREDHLR